MIRRSGFHNHFVTAVERLFCHVERSETSLSIPTGGPFQKSSEILRFAQNDREAAWYNASTLWLGFHSLPIV
jgi:hypothetical protein